MTWKEIRLANIDKNIDAANRAEGDLNSTLINLSVFVITFAGPLFLRLSTEGLSETEKTLLFFGFLGLLFSILFGIISLLRIRKFHQHEASRQIRMLENDKNEVDGGITSSAEWPNYLQVTFFAIGLVLEFSVITLVLF